MPHRNLLVLLATIAASYLCYVQGAHNPYCQYVANGLSAIKENSLETVPSNELFDGAMQGMVDVLRRRGDQHSQFLSEAEAGPLRSEIHQQFGGIGVRIGMLGDPPQLKIVAPSDPGTPAAKANLLPGDVIVQIDEKLTAGMGMSDVLDMLRGDPGTPVRLLIRRAPETKPRLVELVRDVIQIDSIFGDRRDVNGRWQFLLPNDRRIAHVRIVSFGERTARELANVLKQTTDQGAQAVVLDLRDNAGGALDAAVAVCEMLLPAGETIVETRGRGETLRQRYVSKSDGEYRGLPLAVLVNQNSASAAEIVAACLQDHQRAIVVGERSYGKGTVQQLVPLESGKSLLKLTWASFRRPNGTNLHHAIGAPADATWGVVPDAGYERTLSPEEYAAYLIDRNRRDEFGQNEMGDARGSATAAMPAAADFVDEPLHLAASVLQRKLGDTP